VVRSQTVISTPGPSFAHNLGCRCPNYQCEGIFDIYVSRPFQRHQEHPNARCFAPFCRALNIRESRETPNSQLFQVLGFTPTLGQVRVATLSLQRKLGDWVSSRLHIFILFCMHIIPPYLEVKGKKPNIISICKMSCRESRDTYRTGVVVLTKLPLLAWMMGLLSAPCTLHELRFLKFYLFSHVMT
jgi:hypothetical protein